MAWIDERKNELSELEAESRATNALRRALTTPHKPQRSMIGKTGRSWTRKRKRNAKKGKESR